MIIWVTRTQPQADATAARLRALGHEPIVAPVLEVQPIHTPIDLTGVDALAFTSINAIAAFASLSPARNLPTFTVGDATAAAATAAGFTDVRSAGGDVHALAELIAHAPRPSRVLHPGALELAADLAALLADRGVQARHVPIYRTVETALTGESCFRACR